MYQKLQRNLDIIQYLFKDTSSGQLAWRKDEGNRSLGELICHLCDVEEIHRQACLASRCRQVNAPTKPNRNAAPQNPFAAYACHRTQTIDFLKQIDASHWQQRVCHQLFGWSTLEELVTKINEYDQTYIRQMQHVFDEMPRNPLFARAQQEIGAYHCRYQAHLIGVRSILDIGVGSGLALRYLMQQHPDLDFTGVDIRDLRLSDVCVPLQVYNGYTLPFKSKRFDVSLLFYVLHHCQNPERVLDEAIRVTRQKLLIIEEFNLPGADDVSLEVTERLSHRALGLPSDMPYQLFDRAEFETMIKRRSLIEIDRQQLPSTTTRPVQKYLFVINVP